MNFPGHAIVTTFATLVQRFGKARRKRSLAPEALTVTLVSFGYKYGLPEDADIVFDVRFLPNPYYVEELRPLTGADAPVKDYLDGVPEAAAFVENVAELLGFVIAQHLREKKGRLRIAIGCTGGRHRSVYVVDKLRGRFAGDRRLAVAVDARDIAR